MTKSILLSVFFTVIHLFATAQTRGLFVPTDNGQTEPAANENRVALVIGNRTYSGGWQPLRNPANDASLMATTLQNVGFEVISLTNASREDMISGINQLTAKITGKQTVALVYYAGHGVEAEGKNWLVPVNDRSSCRDDIAANCISLDFINNKLKNAGTAFNIIISDACRNNSLPFTCPTSGRDGSKTGFVEFKAKGSCIAFSTAPNATAADGSVVGHRSPERLAEPVPWNKGWQRQPCGSNLSGRPWWPSAPPATRGRHLHTSNEPQAQVCAKAFDKPAET